MGNCFGDEKHKIVEKEIKDREKEMKKEVKLLLLGAGESGKSTFHKQIKIMFETGFSKEALLNYKNAIYANILTTIASLTKSCHKHNIELANEENKKGAAKIVEISKDAGLSLNATTKYTKEIHEYVCNLWKDPAIQQAFKNTRYDYHIFDGAEYFFSDLDRLAPPGYEVSSEDILHCRRKTTGIVELQFEYGGLNFKLFDVGGQRNERKKWIHCFSEVTAVIFVVSMSDYDQKCYEDDVTNRMQESLELFDEIVNGNWFKNTTIMLFLNKVDLFKKKIETTDLNVCFSEYDGGCSFENASKFIEQKFHDVNKFDPKRIHVHFTCATDKESVRQAFDSVKDIILKNNLHKQTNKA